MRILVAGILILSAVVAVAQQAAQSPTVAQVLDRRLSGAEKEFLDLAEAMPESKFNFAPTQGEFKGVRTFGQQLTHVGTTNTRVCSAILGEKPPEMGAKGEEGPASLKTKTEIIKYARDSFALCHRAAQSITTENMLAPIPGPFAGGHANRLTLFLIVYGDVFDHYGQLVEYGRMNGIVPPASRPKK